MPVLDALISAIRADAIEVIDLTSPLDSAGVEPCRAVAPVKRS